MPLLWFIATLIVFIGLYFLPTIIAERRRHADLLAIFLINLLLGWTFIGWIFALVWSMCVPSNSASLSERLDELEKLRASGKISAEEFQKLREKVLSSAV
jgi:hypothetical protein